MAIVRKATEGDIPAILVMGAHMHAESPSFRDLDFSEEKLLASALYLLGAPKEGGILVAENKGRIVGMLAFVVSQYYFGRDVCASDLCAYVKPEFRGGSAFPRLVQAFEKWADEIGVKDKLLGVSTGIDNEGIASMLERIGYERYSIGLRKKGVSHV